MPQNRSETIPTRARACTNVRICALARGKRTKGDGRLTAHGEGVGEKVAGIGDQEDKARLDLGIPTCGRRGGGQFLTETGKNPPKDNTAPLTEFGMLEHEAAAESEEDAEGHGAQESEEEDADAVEEGEDVDLFAVELRQGPVVGAARSSVSLGQYLREEAKPPARERRTRT